MTNLRTAARALLRAPVFTVTSVLTLAIGVAGVTAVFAVFHAVLMQPLPVHAPDELVVVELRREDGTTSAMFSYPQYELLRSNASGLAGLAAWSMEEYTTDAADGEVRIAFAYEVSPNYFDVLGLQPAAGRFFREAEDDAVEGNAVVVISHAMWQNRFGGAGDVVGSTLRVNGKPLTVVGIAPAGFAGTVSVLPGELWVPLTLVPTLRDAAGMHQAGGMFWLTLGGRLSPGTTVPDAQATLSAVVQGIMAREADMFDPRTGLRELRAPVSGVKVTRLRGLPEMAVGAAAGFMGLLFAAALLVLIIGSVNLTALMLARITTRQRELAVRRSLGASRGQLVRQLATEHGLLFGLGTIAGLMLTFWMLDGLPLLLALLPIPARLDAVMTPGVLAFAATLAVLLSVVFGLPPALQGARAGEISLLGRLRPHGGRAARFRSALVVAQIAFCMLLLVSAGLLTRALQRALGMDPGFDASSVVVAEIDLGTAGYDPARSRIFFDELLRRLAARPGVEAAGFSTLQPLLGYSTVMLRPEGQPEPPQGGIDANRVDAGFFTALKVPIVTGRAFGPGDAAATVAPVVVNEAFAERFWPAQDPIGRVVYFGPPDNERAHTVVGVTPTGRYRSLDEAPRPFAYFSAADQPVTAGSIYVRGPGDAGALIRAVTDEVRALDAAIPVRGAAPLQRRVGVLLLPQRIGAAAVGAFGLIGLLLATVGVYGLVAFNAAQRTREIGIRMAVGADAPRVVRLFVLDGAKLMAVGGTIGLVMAVAAAQLLRSLLYGLSAADPVTFLLVPLLLATVALLAAWIPARRAGSLEPAVVLRVE